MKYKISFILIALLLTCVLSGCSKGIKGDEAKAYVNSFLEAIEQEDYETADSLFHPDKQASVAELCTALEMGLNIDFQDGIEVKDYTGFSSALYDTTVKGSTYSLTMDATVSSVELEISVQLVRNENGYGIYSYNFLIK